MTPLKLVRLVVILLIVEALIGAGIVLRRQIWVESRSARFGLDIRNAYRWGTRANDVGYWNLYDETGPPGRDIGFMQLDYPPGRLAVMTAWVAWTRRTFPTTSTWYDDYAFNAPLLRFNTACELAGAVATTLLIGLWIARSRGSVPIRDHRPRFARWPAESCVWGIVGGLLLWFNPAVLWDAHVWPQWEAWAVGLFLVAALCASLERWWLCGVVVGVSALLKGQTLLGAPVLVLWPLLGGRLAAAGRCVNGALTTIVLFVSPWLVRDARVAPAYAVSVGAIVFAVGTTAGAVALVMQKPVRARFGRTAAFQVGSFVLVLSLLACPALFGGSMAWFEAGFWYGTYHYPSLHMGPVANLPALLGARFGWNRPTDLVFGQVTLKTVLVSAYVVCLVLSGLAAAIQSRRGSVRVLLALSAPWIIFYAVLAQMHERYLVFAAGITAIAAGAGVGYILLHLILTVIAVAAMIVSRGGGLKPEGVGQYLSALFPDAGYAVVLIAAIFLWAAFSRDCSVTRRSERDLAAA